MSLAASPAARRVDLQGLALAALPTLGPVLVGGLLGSGGVVFKVAFGLLVVLLLGYTWVLRDRPVVLVTGFLIWLTVERLLLTTVSPRLDSTTLTWLLAYKEFFFPAMFLVGLRRAKVVWDRSSNMVRFVDVAAICFGIAIVVALALTGAPFSNRILYARRFAELPLVYLAGRLLPIRLGDARAIMLAIVAVAVPVAIFGFLERSVWETLIWRDLAPASQYYHLSMQGGIAAYAGQANLERLYQGLPLNFWQFGAGDTVRRLVSTYMEPTTLAMYLAIAGAVALSLWPRKWPTYVVTAVLVVAAVLTLGKAGLLVFGAAGGYAVLAGWRPELRRPSTVVGIAAAIGVAVAVGAVAMQAFGSWSSVLAHLRGLKEGLDSVVHAPFGTGLGYGGDFGIGQAGAESSIGVMLIQIGLPGLGLWLAWLVGLAVACAYAARKSELGLVWLTLSVAVFAFLITAAFTESAGGLLGNWPYALLPAIAVGIDAGRAGESSGGKLPVSRIGAWLGARR
jgi:hypothetical protein